MGGGMGRGMGGGKGSGMGRGMGGGMGSRSTGATTAAAQQSQSTAPRNINASQPMADLAAQILAVPSQGSSMDDMIDPRFGRAAGFVVVDTQTMTTRHVNNDAAQARAQGAGIQAVESLANAGVQTVLAGRVGPKAFAAMSAAGISVCLDVEGMTVRQAVDLFIAGGLPMARTPNAEAGENK
jgi:predicted Fe-Mo cluster-binding NifX family protein